MRFNNVIVKRPSVSIVDGISNENLGIPDYERALTQHDNYIKALKKCGVKVTVLKGDPEFPDSTFVEDPAVVTKEFAIITNPGAESRRNEIIKIKETLKGFFPNNMKSIKPPANLEGGDVMQVEDHFYVGISERTNEEGAEQFISFIEEYGYTGSLIYLEELLHLKTGIAYIGDNTLVATEHFINNPRFSDFNIIRINEDEQYAANCIRVNDYVLVPEGYPVSKKAIEKAGFKTISVDVSEFKKLDGGLSCLSLRF